MFNRFRAFALMLACLILAMPAFAALPDPDTVVDPADIGTLVTWGLGVLAVWIGFKVVKKIANKAT